MSIFSELLARDLRFRGSLGREKRGYSEFGEYVDFIQRAFPDFNDHIEEVVNEDDHSFAPLTYTGTQRAEVFGIAPTGRRVDSTGAARLAFRGDRIASVWGLSDIHGLLQKLEDRDA